jgi:GT2 family glycosyltransferase
MASDCTVGMMMPEILNSDGTVQYLPKLLPSPLSIVKRKMNKSLSLFEKFTYYYELRGVSKDRIYIAPLVSGCFTLLSVDALKQVGTYDESFFMYFEDWDLSRRFRKHYKTIYFPKTSVVHEYESGANKSFKLLKIYVISAITYFNKWGWFFDHERKIINKATMSQFK